MRLATTQEFDAPEATYPYLGLLICALFSAVFWTGLLAVADACLGQRSSASLLLTVAVAITAFLCAALSPVLAAR
jgi:hypothetical protein